MIRWHRNTTLLLVVVLLLLLGRHIWVSCFIHPYADDLSYAVTGAKVGLLEGVGMEYRSWNGRYFANILVLRSPLQLGPDKGLMLYRCFPVLLMLLTISSVYLALRSVLSAAIPKRKTLLAALAFLIVFIHLMPNAGEGLYWYTGAVTYLLPDLFILLCISLVLQWKPGSGRLRNVLVVGGSAVLVAAIVGSNEVVMVQVMLLLALALVLCWKHRVRPALIALLFLSMLCAGLVYFAPGNDVRGSNFENTHDILRTFTFGAAQTVRFIGMWVLSPVYLFATLLILQWGRGLANDRPERQLFGGLSRWVVLVLPIALVFVAMALPYWSTGILGQHRTANAALFVFLPSTWLAFLVWDAQVFQERGWRLFPDAPFLRYVGSAAVGSALLFLRQDGAVTMDWSSGALEQYDQQYQQRYALVREAIASGAAGLELEPLRNVPLSLTPIDLSTDPQNYMNRSLVHYLGGDTLRVRIRNEEGSAF